MSVYGSDSTEKIPKDCNYYRNLWWDKGDYNSKANWEEVTLPYKLAIGVTLDEYERRVEKFDVHGYWEWTDGDVIIYELPSEPHEICIGAITEELMDVCRLVKRTNAQICSLGSTHSPHGSDGHDCPWPNLVIEVAYSETIDHVTKKVNEYWLKPNRVHDTIVAWHYCISDRVTRNTLPARTMFDFGMQDGAQNALNIQPDTCVINIQLECLYHDLDPTIQIPQNIPNPIALD
ncbi:hypothetical protein C1645_826997 [Glomus cerebriforme]|uniref:Restriction endonuclease domain-containing protein n=1 Tax=Glomus cerebriforme TaxID=658196 RepID=A0A397SPR0_9GLOM|nr:hypothetical protein C1645_826997 [Glomus cerebriforme]